MKKVLSLIIAILLTASMSIFAFAKPTPFITVPLTDEEQATFVENVPVKKIDSIDWRNSICSFDVNEQEMILLLFCRSSQYTICVYNSDFDFQYGFSFDSYGSVACEWSDNDIMVYFVRSEIYAKLEQNGQWSEVNQLQNSFENNSLTTDLLYNRTEVTVESTTYKIQNDMGILNFFQSDFSQLVKIDEKQNETILYDINTAQTIKTIVILLLVTGFVFISLYKTLTLLLKRNQKVNPK